MIKKIGKYKFAQYIKGYNKFKKEIPLIIANNSKNHFLKGFTQGAQRGGGFTDTSRGGWKKRQKETRLSARKGILIKRGILRAFIRTRSILEKRFERIVIGVRGIRYAARHNEGLDRMPQREFIGDSRVLDKKNKVLIFNRLKRIFI